ncbi:MAG: hypothetical protein JHC87_05165 [Thermoleophilaceae bacterium]|nr:hypothetical protein [Thermoleophilaceae bacterium]
MLKHLLSSGEKVVYLDADVRVYGSLDVIVDHLEEHPILLTPHILSGLPADGMSPSDLDIIKSGAYNTGFIGVRRSAQTNEMLDWWCGHTADKQPDAPNGQPTNDQIWAGLMPSLFPAAHILRDPSLNVAYWNLHERQLTKRDGDFYVGDQRLRFFHFSGFSPDSPSVLSKYSDRFSPLEHEPLATLCEQYTRELEMAGYFEFEPKPYRWRHTPSGIELNTATLPYFRSMEDGAPSESVLSEDGERAWLDWLGSPACEAAGGAHGVSQLLAQVWNDRPDLQAAFPDLAGDDGPRLLQWQAASGVLEDQPPRAITELLQVAAD